MVLKLHFVPLFTKSKHPLITVTDQTPLRRSVTVGDSDL